MGSIRVHGSVGSTQLRPFPVRLLSSAAVLGIVGALVQPGASHAVTIVSQGTGQIINGTVLGAPITPIVNVEAAHAENTTGLPPTVVSDKPPSATLLAALGGITVGPASVNLFGAGGIIQLGAVGQYAEAAPDGSSKAFSGAVTQAPSMINVSSGAVTPGNVGAPTAGSTAEINVGTSTLLGGVNLVQLGVHLGALAASAIQTGPIPGPGTQSGAYNLASADIVVGGTVVTGVISSISTPLNTLITALNGLGLSLTNPFSPSGITLTTADLLAVAGVPDLNSLPPDTDLMSFVPQAVVNKVLSITNTFLGTTVPGAIATLPPLLQITATALLAVALATINPLLAGLTSTLLTPLTSAIQAVLQLIVNHQSTVGGAFTETALEVGLGTSGLIAAINVANASVGPNTGFDSGTTLTVTKTVVNPPPSAPANYPMTVTCSNPGAVFPITVVPGTPSMVAGLTVGQSCTVTEDSTPANATVTYAGGDGPPGPTNNTVVIVTGVPKTIAVTNTFNSTINLSKMVVNPPANNPPGSYTVTVVCTPAGGSPGTPVSVVLPADGTVVPLPGGAPLGSSCTISELTPPPGATSPSQTITVNAQTMAVTVTNTFSTVVQVTKTVLGTPPGPAPATYEMVMTCTPPAGGAPIPPQTIQVPPNTTASFAAVPDGSTCTVTETPPPDSPTTVVSPSGSFVATGATFPVTVTNTYTAPGSTLVVLSKTVVGAPPAPAPSSYTVTMMCSPPGGGPAVPVTVPPLPADGTPVAVSVLTGSQCTVSEVPPAGVISTVIVPPQPFTATGATFNVTVTNTFPPPPPTTVVGVTKNVVGESASAPALYTVTMTCTPPAGGAPIPPQTIQVPPSSPGSSPTPFAPVLTGSTCTVTETPPSGSPTAVIVPSGPFTATGATFDVTVTNTFLTVVQVTKNVEGVPPGPPPASYPVTMSCIAADGTPVAPETIQVPPNTPGSAPTPFAAVPEGSNCTVTEPLPPGAVSNTIVPPGPFTATGATFSVTVTNTFPPLAVTAVEVTKVVVGTPPAPVPPSYTVTMMCAPPGGGAVVPVVVAPLPADGTPVFVSVTTGSLCTVTELLPPGALSNSISPTGQFTVTGTTFPVTVTNTFPPPVDVTHVTFSKTVIGTEPTPAPTYQLVLTNCSVAGSPVTAPAVPPVSRGQTTAPVDLATGTTCTIAEVDSHGALVTFTHDGAPLTNNTFTATGAGETFDVSVSNDFSGPQVVTMQVNLQLGGLGGLARAGDTFNFDLTCTKDGAPVAGFDPHRITVDGAGFIEGTNFLPPVFVENVQVGSTCSVVAVPGFGAIPPGAPLVAEFIPSSTIPPPAPPTPPVESDSVRSLKIPAAEDLRVDAKLNSPRAAPALLLASPDSLRDAPVDTFSAPDPPFASSVATFAALDAPLAAPVVTLAAAPGVVLNLLLPFAAGTVILTKNVIGPDVPTGAQFAFAVTCESRVPAAGGGTTSLFVRGTATIGTDGVPVVVIDSSTGLPLLGPGGSRCYAVETDSQGATSSFVAQNSFETGALVPLSPEDFNVDQQQAALIEATNIFDHGVPGSEDSALASSGGRPGEGVSLAALAMIAGLFFAIMKRRRHA